MEEKLLGIINQVLDKQNARQLTNLDGELSLRDDLGFDSLMLAELTVKLEVIYDVDIFENGPVDKIQQVINSLA